MPTIPKPTSTEHADQKALDKRKNDLNSVKDAENASLKPEIQNAITNYRKEKSSDKMKALGDAKTPLGLLIGLLILAIKHGLGKGNDKKKLEKYENALKKLQDLKSRIVANEDKTKNLKNEKETLTNELKDTTNLTPEREANINEQIEGIDNQLKELKDEADKLKDESKDTLKEHDQTVKDIEEYTKDTKAGEALKEKIKPEKDKPEKDKNSAEKPETAGLEKADGRGSELQATAAASAAASTPIPNAP